MPRFSNKVVGGYPTLFHILPYDKNFMAQNLINELREKDRALSANLESGLAKLLPFTVPTYRSGLVVGRRYGVFGISPYANAVREGTVVPNHGEVYLYVWTLGDDGLFYTKTVWDGYTFSAYPGRSSGAGQGLLVEL